MANPKRWAWTNQREMKRQYQYTFATHFVLGGLLAWPLGVAVGRWSQKTTAGVPRIPINRFVHDFINLDPSAYAIRRFRRYCFGTMALCGTLFAYATVDERLV